MIRATLFAIFFLLTTTLSAHEQSCRVAVRHIEGGGIGYKKGYTTIEGFFSPGPEVQYMPFFDARGHIFNNGKGALNVGAGLRTIAGQRVYGINAYYDFRSTQTCMHYSQVGFGAETLGKLWDFRINGYLPVGKCLSSPATFAGFSGNTMMLFHDIAMKGFNAELSFHFGQFLSQSPSFDLYAGAGPYYFTQKSCANSCGNIWGGKVRLGCKFNDYVRLELRNSYDATFRNKFQCELTFSLPFGKKECAAEKDDYNSCALRNFLNARMVQPVERQEIIVVKDETNSAIDPATGNPYNFVFVNNTSNSKGTYESPYPTLKLAQDNSKVNDIIYVFPGDGTTKGMNAGITLKNNQKFWGSGIDQSVVTTQGTITVPAQSSSSPTITNTDVDTEGNGITLAAVNQVRGITVSQALANGIIGADVQSVAVDKCTLKDNAVFALNTSSNSQAAVIVTNSTITGVNGVNLNFSGSSKALISRNIFTNLSSVSEFPLTITAGMNPLTAVVQGNKISNNTCGGMRFVLSDTDAAQLLIADNMISNNGTGSLGQLGSPLVVNPNATTSGDCNLTLAYNTFANNTGSALYCSSGSFNKFDVNITRNMITDNGGGLVFANPCNTFGLAVNNNMIAGGSDHAITTAGGITITEATINIANNQITGNTNSANGIALSHEGTDLNLVVTQNTISNNEGSGIVLYSSAAIDTVVVDIENNAINNNQNAGSNTAGGIDVEQYATLSGVIANNALSTNTSGDFYTGSTAVADPSMCLTMVGNTSDTGYTIVNTGAGAYNLAPCTYATVNTGSFNFTGTITPVQSCPDAVPCS
jgi:hypothetical protein